MEDFKKEINDDNLNLEEPEKLTIINKVNYQDFNSPSTKKTNK